MYLVRQTQYFPSKWMTSRQIIRQVKGVYQKISNLIETPPTTFQLWLKIVNNDWPRIRYTTLRTDRKFHLPLEFEILQSACTRGYNYPLPTWKWITQRGETPLEDKHKVFSHLQEYFHCCLIFYFICIRCLWLVAVQLTLMCLQTLVIKLCL